MRWHPVADVLEGLRVGIDKDNTLLLSRTPGGHWRSAVSVLPTTVDTVYAAGEIETDLWTAIMTDPVLAEMPRNDRVNFVDRLDRVFQWRIDFFTSIRTGDTYRFVFEREKRPDGSMRSGSLLAAELVNQGDPHYAILFDPNGDGQGTWYDLEGESVRRAFLMRPLKFSRISSRYTNSRFHPILQTWRAHRGVDYAAAAGTPVEVTADGVVARRGWSDSYGRVVDVRHGNGFLTRYAHLQGFAAAATVGSRVRQGQTIGYVGMTGLATAPPPALRDARGRTRRRSPRDRTARRRPGARRRLRSLDDPEGRALRAAGERPRPGPNAQPPRRPVTPAPGPLPASP